MNDFKAGKLNDSHPGKGGSNQRPGGDVPGQRRLGSERLAPEARQGNGLEAYRRWLTRVQAPGSRRIPLDPSLYTWKGYRNWTDRVRRDWKPGE
ncbi:MAG: hypothetical protein D6727_01365 [Gammaproteobacteria bacterium]|nr:MAG: hypothetical protein D6727_01365 [Gammaproteobacteria bacterium]